MKVTDIDCALVVYNINVILGIDDMDGRMGSSMCIVGVRVTNLVGIQRVIISTLGSVGVRCINGSVTVVNSVISIIGIGLLGVTRLGAVSSVIGFDNMARLGMPLISHKLGRVELAKEYRRLIDSKVAHNVDTVEFKKAMGDLRCRWSNWNVSNIGSDLNVEVTLNSATGVVGINMVSNRYLGLVASVIIISLGSKGLPVVHGMPGIHVISMGGIRVTALVCLLFAISISVMGIRGVTGIINISDLGVMVSSSALSISSLDVYNRSNMITSSALNISSVIGVVGLGSITGLYGMGRYLTCTINFVVSISERVWVVDGMIMDSSIVCI